MTEGKETKLFVELFAECFWLLFVVHVNDKNSEANGAVPLCISDCGLKMESAAKERFYHSDVNDKCKRLVHHGFLISESGSGGRKNLRLAPVVAKIFDDFEELKKGVEE